MASSSGTSSASITSLQNSEENQPITITDQRKRKRMISNRESARRSRMRKQKHLGDLMAEVSQLRAENNHMLRNLNVVNHLHLSVELENDVLRAQMAELNNRLQSLNGIVSAMNSTELKNDAVFGSEDFDFDEMISGADYFFNDWSLANVNLPIMAADGFMY